MLTGNEKRIFLAGRPDRPRDEAGDHRDRGPPLLHERRHRPARHRPRALARTSAPSRRVQGGSTITMQFVKNALAAQDERTLFNKLREAALAYQITRKWSKERILRNYLNTIYFGNGAYGIEAAARTYFGSNHPGCGEDGKPKCAQVLAPARGGADRRHGRLAERLRPARATARPPASAARSCSSACASRATSRRRRSSEARRESLPTQPRHPAAGRGHGLPLLHVVGQAAGRRQARRRPGGRAPRVRGRPDRPHDARLRLQDAAAARRRPVAAVARAARAPRSSRSTTTRARCSRWWAATTTPRARSTSPPRASASPAPSFKPFVLAQALSDGVSPDSTWNSQKIDICVARTQEGQVQGVLRRQQLRGRLRRHPHAADGDDVSPTTPSTRSSACRSARRRSPGSRAGWASARRSRTTSR